MDVSDRITATCVERAVVTPLRNARNHVTGASSGGRALQRLAAGVDARLEAASLRAWFRAQW